VDYFLGRATSAPCRRGPARVLATIFKLAEAAEKEIVTGIGPVLTRFQCDRCASFSGA
jgi:hypothetical protein